VSYINQTMMEPGSAQEDTLYHNASLGSVADNAALFSGSKLV
jgi:hypothetical protein